MALFFTGPEAHIYRTPRLTRQAVPLTCPLGRVLQCRLLWACLISTKLISEKSAWGFKLLLQLIRYCFTDWVVPSERWAAIYFPCPLLKFKPNCKIWLFDCLVQSRDCFAQGIDIHLYANAELIWALLNGYRADDKHFVQMPLIHWKGGPDSGLLARLWTISGIILFSCCKGEGFITPILLMRMWMLKTFSF